MAVRRKYAQGCGTAHALDLVGDRWALLVVRELVFGPKRFTDLRDGLPGIGPNVLSQRLKELEEVGVLRRRTLPPPAGSTVYELTEWGSELEDIVIRLGRWGARDPDMPREVETQPEWLVLGMRAVYDPDDEPEPTVYELRFGDDVFWARVDDGSLRVGRGEAADADAVLTAEVEAIAMLVRGELKPAAALRSGLVKLGGDRDAFLRFPSLFRFPPS
ncbi:MAG TPA: winged helix-turn-helix transcriptional regulator, partial [Gaiellaceae bacterium]